MNSIIEMLHDGLMHCSTYHKETLLNELKLITENGDKELVLNYPVAIKNKTDNQNLYRVSELQDVIDKREVRSVDMMLLQHSIELAQYTVKRSHDYWKRLSSVDHIQAMVACLCVDANACSDASIENDLNQSLNSQWSVESKLRDAMRANKENRDLGSKPFIVIMAKERKEIATDHIHNLLKHYFGPNTLYIASSVAPVDYYLAYSEALGSINMRYFYQFAS